MLIIILHATNNVSSDPHQWEMMIPKDFAVLFSKSTVMRFAHQGHAIIIR